MDEVNAKNLSLRALKKMLMQKEFDAGAEKRKLREKEKRKERLQRRRDQGIKTTKNPIVSMKDSGNRMPLAIDLDFNELMGDKEMRKLVAQIQRCYATNRRHEQPCQLHLTSCSADFRARIEKQSPGSTNWDVHFHEQSYMEVFKEFAENGTLIYLSPDATDSLPDTDSLVKSNGNFAYVIGGLVDHNAHKGLTKSIAEKKGIKHAKLPIDEYIQLSCSRVLTVNHGRFLLQLFCFYNHTNCFFCSV